jgi:hypothetical protein
LPICELFNGHNWQAKYAVRLRGTCSYSVLEKTWPAYPIRRSWPEHFPLRLAKSSADLSTF